MELRNVDDIDAALQKLSAVMRPWNQAIEWVELDSCNQRILAQDIVAAENIPAFPRSRVDGYALCANDVMGAREDAPCFITCIGRVEMGQNTPIVGRKGTCVYVPTGGMIPEGYDAVVMVEYVQSFGFDQMAIYKASAVGAHIVPVGEDIQINTPLLVLGTRITVKHLGILATLGYQKIPVYKKPKVTLISTGDELVGIDETPLMGQVRDCNQSLLFHALLPWCEVIQQIRLRDNKEAWSATLREAMQTSDMIMVSGGSSQGDKDYTATSLDACGSPGVFTHGLAMKPGKPTILGCADNVVLIGLPGHPFAALMVFHTIVEEALRLSFHVPKKRSFPARLKGNLYGGNGRHVCQLVRLEASQDGWWAIPILGASGLVHPLSQSDGFLNIDRNLEGLQHGAYIQVTTW